MYLAFCVVLRHLKSWKKVYRNDDTCKTFKKKYQFRVGGVNIDVTTLQRDAYFLKQFSDVCSGLQCFLASPGLGGFWMWGGVYINMV